MEILKLIEKAATKGKNRFLVIGGHALNIHGISRTTGDLDLMVEASERGFWRQLLTDLRYTIYQESSSFIQTTPSEIAAWPIDLMLVSKETMEKALADAHYTELFGTRTPFASVGNLIAMKLHSLKYEQAERTQKDQGDLLALLKIATLPLNSEPFRQLCLKYANVTVYERLIKLNNS